MQAQKRACNFNPLFPYGERHGPQIQGRGKNDFNPLFPYGERRLCSGGRRAEKRISIHSSHTGRDARRFHPRRCRRYFNPLFPYGERPYRGQQRQPQQKFQSTLPIREETKRLFSLPVWGDISIHSSHTGRDQRLQVRLRLLWNFNPLFPYGERLSMSAMRTVSLVFQSTLPIRGETLTR